MVNRVGVDLSQNQAISSFAQFNAAADFAYIRVRRSNGEFDSMWREFHSGITKPRAPYIFLRPPSVESFTAQLRSFWGRCGDYAWEWGPVLDAEYTGLTGAQLRDAVSACRDVTQRSVVYGYVGYGNLRPGGSATPNTWVIDGHVRIIGARYFANDSARAFANFGMDDPNLDIVQYWNRGSFPGISGEVDLNVARRLILAQEGTNDVELSDKLPPIKLSDGRDYTLTVGDVMRGMAQYISGDVKEDVNTTGHPAGQYVSRIVNLSNIDANVTKIAGALPANQAALIAVINDHAAGGATQEDLQAAFRAVLGDGWNVTISPRGTQAP